MEKQSTLKQYLTGKNLYITILVITMFSMLLLDAGIRLKLHLLFLLPDEHALLPLGLILFCLNLFLFLKIRLSKISENWETSRLIILFSFSMSVWFILQCLFMVFPSVTTVLLTGFYKLLNRFNGHNAFNSRAFSFFLANCFSFTFATIELLARRKKIIAGDRLMYLVLIFLSLYVIINYLIIFPHII